MGRKQKRTIKSDTSYDNSDEEEYSSLPLEERSWGADIQLSIVSTVILLAVYIKTSYPSVAGGDAGEIIVSAHEWGVAHPPGYPLFTLTAKMAMMWLPWGNIAWRVNVLNAFYSAVAGGLLHLCVVRLTGDYGTSLLAVGLFSLSKLTWTWATSAEVFGLNNLMVAALLLMSVIFDMTSEVPKIRKVTYFGSFLCGLALCNQHTIVVYVVFIAVWVLLRLKKYQILNMSMLIKIGLCFILGLSPYVYLPISSYLNIARWTWGDQTTLSGFLTHLLRSEYGTFDLGKGSTGLGFTYGLSLYLEHTYYNLCDVGPLLGLIGTIATLNRKDKGNGCLFVFILMLAAYASLFAWRANLDMSDPLMRGVVERFWMQSDMVMVVLAAVGYQSILRWTTIKVLGESKSTMAIIFAFIGASSIIALQFRNYGECNFSNSNVVPNFANNLLRQLPRNAVVFTKGDLPTNTMRYLHLCEKVRPDLELIDVEMMSYEWFSKLRKFYPRMKYPGEFWHLTNKMWEDGRASYNFKSLLDQNYKNLPMFVCIGMQDKDPSWQDGYTLLPFGVCHKIDDGIGFSPQEWANATGNYSDGWNHRWDSFPDTSWEKVANDEMWHAKISTAFFMYDQAEKLDDPQAKAQLLQASYELYFTAIKKNQKPSKMKHEEIFPAFWHKNFALVLERLLHLDHPMSKAKLCKQSIQHFQQYVSANPNDKDIKGILAAVESLKSRLPTYHQMDEALKKVEDVTKKYLGET